MRVAILIVAFICLVAVPVAHADVGITITTLRVQSGGVLRGHGNAVGMPVYLVPEGRAPRPFRCHGGAGYCAPRTRRPPSAPFIALGRVPGRWTGQYARDVRFAFRLPTLKSGRYQVVVWCKPCGGSLLLAGATLYGQVVTVHG